MGLDNPMESMTALSDATEESGNHAKTLIDEGNDLVAHISSVIDGIDELLNHHGGVYDTPTTTGEETYADLLSVKENLTEVRDKLAAGVDSVERSVAVLLEVSQRIADHRDIIMSGGR